MGDAFAAHFATCEGRNGTVTQSVHTEMRVRQHGLGSHVGTCEFWVKCDVCEETFQVKRDEVQRG